MEEYFDEDILKKIYYNELEALHEAPKDEEYVEITEKIIELEEILLKGENKDCIKRYMEYINERVGIEAENQFKIGFKTAIKIIIQCLK